MDPLQLREEDGRSRIPRPPRASGRAGTSGHVERYPTSMVVHKNILFSEFFINQRFNHVQDWIHSINCPQFSEEGIGDRRERERGTAPRRSLPPPRPTAQEGVATGGNAATKCAQAEDLWRGVVGADAGVARRAPPLMCANAATRRPASTSTSTSSAIDGVAQGG